MRLAGSPVFDLDPPPLPAEDIIPPPLPDDPPPEEQPPLPQDPTPAQSLSCHQASGRPVLTGRQDEDRQLPQ